MQLSLSDRLLRLQLQDPHRSRGKHAAKPTTKVRGLYGDKRWVEDLDIVNELGGHTGCVNALSWSKSGRLLASGSDDTHLNIHTYQADHVTSPFTLATTIATGHSANIFSIKFMPHSNDGTLVSCAGDHQVRVFDIEHANKVTRTEHIGPSSIRHHSGVNLDELYRGVQFLGPSTTDARVYRSHGDRVKRIVTESSPYLFLTCSEDGEVRQWDLRLPSSAYPQPRGPRRSGEDQYPNVPPALISYKRFGLDLNTISCSGNQPHYIVLGGAHVHAFLHDRRMLGRDSDAERGFPFTSTGRTASDDDLMGRATRCVRRFAPNGQSTMNRTDNGHITACKISDANPNEMIGSWSGDHIYAFNLVTSPDARDLGVENTSQVRMNEEVKRTGSNDRKRKRRTAPEVERSRISVEGLERGSPRQRSVPAGEDNDVALRVRYGNGQSEDIPLDPSPDGGGEGAEGQSPSVAIAKHVRKMRQLLFTVEALAQNNTESNPLERHISSFSEVLARACVALPAMSAISSAWSYPLLPAAETVALQNVMRRNRATSYNFVQAAGTLARTLGGNLVFDEDDIQAQQILPRFGAIEYNSQFGSTYQKFCYMFLAAILAWLDGGTTGLLTWFKPKGRNRGVFGVEDSDEEGAIEKKIIPGLLALANEQERAIVNLDANRFEIDQNRLLFDKGADAVTAFSHAIRMPFAENSIDAAASGVSSPSAATIDADTVTQGKATAITYWAFKVGRGLLNSAGEGVNFTFVSGAFGNNNIHGRASRNQSQGTDPIDEDEPIESLSIVRASAGRQAGDSQGFNRDTLANVERVEQDERVSRHSYATEEDSISPNDFMAILDERGLLSGDLDESEDDEFQYEELASTNAHPGAFSDDSADNEDDDDDEDDGDEGEYEEEDGNSDHNEFDPQMIFGNAASLGRNRERVEADVPCESHTRVYRGHCNVKTVKDVNFFGLEDEYVVSGSDCGHMFIWDRKTGALLNILQGDGEVVNVITGHPYEPMLAVSGIDHTIKIFSADQRAQTDARRGVNLGTTSHPGHGVSSLRRLRHRQASTTDETENERASASATSTSTNNATSSMPSDEVAIDQESASNGGLQSCRKMDRSYQITSQNDLDRQGGTEDTFLTRAMLQHFAARLAARRRQAGLQGDDPDNDDEEEAIALEENCNVM